MEGVFEAAQQHPDFAEHFGGAGQDGVPTLQDMRALYTRDAALFLERFGRFLGVVQLRFVKAQHANNVDVAWWADKWQSVVTTAQSESENPVERTSSIVRNRRLKYWNTVLHDSDYVSETQMRSRDPAGWQYFVGQYAPKETVPPVDETEGGPGLGGFFLRSMQKREQRFVEAVQMHADVMMEQMMMGDDNPDDEPMPMVGENRNNNRNNDDDYDEYEDANRMAAYEKNKDVRAEMLEMWRQLHKAKFLAGEDQFFDYDNVDLNEQYDDMKMRREDEEERWFDDDDE